MSLPIVCIPPTLNRLFEPYKNYFSRPQYAHFKRLVTGLIVSDNKTLQEINDSFGERDQSNLNRFVNGNIDGDKLNRLRLRQVKNTLNLKKRGMLIIDESMLHKTGRKMELAGAHRSGITKRIEWGHMMVNSFYLDTDENEFPVKSDVYVKEKDCVNRSFYTKRELALQQVDFALEQGLRAGLVIVDAGYEGEEFTQELKSRGLDFIIGVRVTTKISMNRQERNSIRSYLETLTDDDFEILMNGYDAAYFYHVASCSIRGIGMVRLVISYAYGDEENMKCYITNLEESNEKVIRMLVKRWRIECFHRDAKQHLGLEACQVRKGRGMQIVALACLFAYTLVKLAVRTLKTPFKPLRTIGEVCRYLRLIAYKGVIWFRTKLRKPLEFIKILKKLIFVKNAKA